MTSTPDDTDDLLYLYSRILDLDHRTKNYQTTVSVVGGIFIGVIVILIGVVVYLFIEMMKMRKEFQRDLHKVDPLINYTIKRPQVSHGLVANRFKTSESNFSAKFDIGTPPKQQQQYQASDDVHHFKSQAAKIGEKPKPNPRSFLHDNKSRENPNFNHW